MTTEINEVIAKVRSGDYRLTSYTAKGKQFFVLERLNASRGWITCGNFHRNTLRAAARRMHGEYNVLTSRTLYKAEE